MLLVAPLISIQAAGPDGAWLLELFHTMRDRFDGPAPVRHDPDRLYHTHGDPRD